MDLESFALAVAPLLAQEEVFSLAKSVITGW